MATWFAQASSVNIDSASLWNSVAGGGGTVLTWPPASGDNLVANGNTAIALNVDFNIGTGILTTGTTLGGTAGGNFTLTTARTITAGILAGTTECVSKSGTNPWTWNGTVIGGTASVVGLGIVGTSTFTFTGTASGGSGTGAHGINVSSGTINMTGNAYGGSSTGVGIRHSGGGVTLTMTGNSSGSATGAGVQTTGGTFVLNGNAVAGAGINGVGVVNGQATVFILNNGNIINSTSTSAITGPCQWNPGVNNYVQYPTASGIQRYYPLKFLGYGGMSGGFNG